MEKMEYLKKTFARTAGKNFENYVISQIWAKVEEYGLYPITQQYVKRKNGYALIDLYFPQINFAIEVDEYAHEKNKLLDKIRMDEIFSSVEGIESERIKEGNYIEVREQINDVVMKIMQKIEPLGQLKWEENWQDDEYKKTFQIIKNRKKLLCSDLIGFKRIQVTNDIFNMNLSEGFLKFGKSWFELTQNERLWFPHLTPNKEWKNSVSDDWTIIYEEKLENKPIGSLQEKFHSKNIKRYTFARYKNAFGETSYRFIGVFRFKEKDDFKNIYERISDEIKL
jgi:very-short-patch-repair endonuclease